MRGKEGERDEQKKEEEEKKGVAGGTGGRKIKEEEEEKKDLTTASISHSFSSPFTPCIIPLLFPTPGQPRGDGGGPGSSEPRGTSDADDVEHLPLRRRVLQERHPRRAKTQGDHQHIQAAQGSLPDCVPDGRSGQGCGEGEERAVSPGTYHSEEGVWGGWRGKGFFLCILNPFSLPRVFSNH